MESIDPTAPASYPSPGTWLVVKEICTEYDLEYKHGRREIIEMRDDVIDLNNDNISKCKKGLLCYYKNNFLTLPENACKINLKYYAQVFFENSIWDGFNRISVQHNGL